MQTFRLPPLPANCTLGVNYSGMHDSAIAIVAPDGRPLFAASLERVSRVKQDGRPPHALLAQVPWDRIAKVAVSTNAALEWPAPEDSRLLTTRLPQARADGLRHPPAFAAFLDTIPCPKEFVEHQVAHAASAFWGSGFEEALCLTYDGGMCNSPWFGGLYRASRAQGLQALDQFSALHYAKITSLYTFVTALLGFTPNKHEGKITGLAAYGRPSEACRTLLMHWFERDFLGIEAVMEWVFAYDEQQPPMLVTHEGRIDPYRAQAASFSREELAATVQALAEEHVVDLLARARDLGWRSDNLCLAGGLFANVKINQRAVESGFKHLFVAPPMTDDGTALGAAWHVQSREAGFRPEPLHSMFLGPSYPPAEVTDLLRSEGVRYETPAEPEAKIAALLAEGAVVAVFQGACEFGPRALGNRSILAQATRGEINQQLNARLNRTEFMPFAPMTRIEDMAACYLHPERVAHAMEFMTVTVDCTDAMRQACPAVVHVDGTARPQIVRADCHPLIHRVLSGYVERTGVPAIVNTSFNIHEEPIVGSPADALRGFFESGLDYLYLEGGVLVAFADNHAVALRYLQERVRAPSAKAKSSSLLADLHARKVAHLQLELEVKEAAIHEKEAALHRLADDLQVLTCSLVEKEELVSGQHEALLRQQETLATLLASVHEKDDALHEKDDALHEKDDALHAKEDALQAVTALLNEKDEALHEKDDALQAVTALLQEKEDALREKEDALQSATVLLHEKEQALHGKEEALLAITRSLHEKDDALVAMTRSLQDKEEALQATALSLQQKEQALQAMTATAQERDRSLQEKEKALQDLIRAARKKDKTLRSLSDTVKQQDQALQAQAATLQANDAALREKDAALLEKESAVQEKEDALQAMALSLQQKEQALQAMTVTAQERDRSLQEKEKALQDLTRDARKKDRTLRSLSDTVKQQDQALQAQAATLQANDAALREKDAALLEKESAVREKEDALQDVARSAQLQEAQLQEKHQALADLTRSLREKEAVIQALSAALELERTGSTP